MTLKDKAKINAAYRREIRNTSSEHRSTKLLEGAIVGGVIVVVYETRWEESTFLPGHVELANEVRCATFREDGTQMFNSIVSTEWKGV